MGICTPGTTPPLDTSMRSTPRVFNRLLSSLVCSRSQPPSFQSVAETRTNRGKLAGQIWRRSLYDLENDADAILEAAAKLILPKIAEGRKELVQQISMGGVNLQDFESRRASALRRPSKSVHDFANLAGRECTGPG